MSKVANFYPYTLFVLPMFSYGFLREARSTYKPPYNLFGYKMVGSFCNGILYTIPPYGCLRLFHTTNRIDVFINNKETSTYPDIYKELVGENKNVII